ncbi:MAG: class III signal peptide-containing protein [Bdellovibrionales bacterium]|nr:class III signal peptide-containing protein [Bdellovibrionales bacterium]
MKNVMKRTRKNKGQSTLEYALVIGVIVTAIIIAAQNFVVGEDSAAGKLFGKAIDKAGQTLDDTE